MTIPSLGVYVRTKKSLDPYRSVISFKYSRSGSPSINKVSEDASNLKSFEKYPKLIELCTIIPRKAYSLGGGQLKDWENPFKTDKEKMEKFIKCYHNSAMAWCKDKNGRRFWFDPIWYDSYLKMIENNLIKK